MFLPLLLTILEEKKKGRRSYCLGHTAESPCFQSWWPRSHQAAEAGGRDQLVSLAHFSESVGGNNVTD